MSKRWLGLLLFAIWIGSSGVARAAVTESPDPLDIGNVVVDQTKTGTAKLSDGGTTDNVTVEMGTGGDCGQFTIQSPTGSVTVGPGMANDVSVLIDFKPTSRGNKSCVVTVKRMTTVLLTFTVKGKGIGPVVTVTAGPLDFGTIDVGQMSTPQIVTATNNGDAPLTITSGALKVGDGDSDYTATLNPPGDLTLNVGDSASWNVVCKPSAQDSRDGTFEVKSDAVNLKTAPVELRCIGNLGTLTTLVPTVDFDRVPRATTKTLMFTLKNMGNATVDGIQATLAPMDKGFAIDQTTVPMTLGMNASAMVKVTFTPRSKADGVGGATVSFSGTWGNARMAMGSITLAGIDASFHVATQTLDLGTFRIDMPSQKTFPVLNDGNASLVMKAKFISEMDTTAEEISLGLEKNAIPQIDSVPLNANEQFTVIVKSQVQNRIGLLRGHIDVTSDVMGQAPQQVTVTGEITAGNVEITPHDGVDFGVVDINAPPPQRTITIKNTGNAPLQITNVESDGENPGSLPNPAFRISLPGTLPTLAPNETMEIVVTYQPTAATNPALPDLVIIKSTLRGVAPEPVDAVTRIVGEAVFVDARGSGGCNTGGAGGGLLLGLGALGALQRRRRRNQAPIAIAVATAILAIAPAARADGVGLTVFEPTPATTGAGFALQAPDVGASGSWVANATASYASNPLVFITYTGDNNHTTTAPVARSTLMQVGLAYALLDRFELGAHIPLYQQSGDGGEAARGMARGNLALHAKARLVRARLGGTLVGGISAIGVVPTASKNQYTGSDQPELRLLVLGSFTPAALSSRLTLSVNAGPVIRNKSEFKNITQQSGVAWGGGASIRILDELWATAELFGQSTPSAQGQKPAGDMMPSKLTLSQVEALAGLTIRPDRRFVVGLALGRGVTGAIGTPDLRGVLSLSVVPGASALAPIHPPEVPRPDGDADGDGIRDSIDNCPNEPEDKDMFEDQDGCPDPDNDHDGIPDENDRCPLDPEDKDGFQDDDGCPDLDNDGDGIPDSMDKCPNEPEDKDGFEDLDGCPDPDNDHDGIPDDKDKCPTQPETINAFQDDDGCPDKGDSTIVLSPDRIETLDPVQFNGLKPTKASIPMIAQVGATLRAHNEIVRLRITVHVQPTRDPDADQERSDKRAQAIREWLVQWGIAPNRLEARGFGSSKPLVPPEQRGAAKINDRLELIILERK